MSEKTKWTLQNILEHYEITEDGRVFSNIHNWRGWGRREMRHTPNADGYPRVRLTICGKRKSIAVHRLVAMAYLPPKPSVKHEIRHIDGNKKNPHKQNLAWGTPKDNAKDRAVHGRTCMGENHPRAKVNQEAVLAIRERWRGGESFKSLATKYGISPTQASNICRERSWSNV